MNEPRLAPKSTNQHSSPRHPLRRGAAALSLVFLLAGCALDQGESRQSFEESRASHFFSVGYQDVADIYIDQIEVSDMAVAGLENLSIIDPKITIARDAGELVLSFDAAQSVRLTTPGQEDARAWGEVTAAAIRASREHSKQLASVGSEDVYEAIFDGVTARLDSFSRYAGRDEARENRASRDGFGGIGVRISLVDEGVKVLSVMENTPAERAGIEDSDVVVLIDGETAAGLSQREVVSRLRGPLRSKVRLTIKREPELVPRLIEVTRAHIVPQTVNYRTDRGVGYFRVSGFNQSTARTLKKKIEMAERELGDKALGYVLDLRGNPGGLLDQSVAVSDLFLPGGRIVSTHGRHPDSHQYFDADTEDRAAGRRLVVLINANSASASEIVAAALQDSGRAVVVGSNSFGKGTVQTVLRLPNEGELTLTWARFHAPTGYSLNRRGVIPDICTSKDIKSAADALKRLREGRFPIDLATRRTDLAPNDDSGLQNLKAHCPGTEEERDIDLEIAIDLLSDPSLYDLALRGVPNTAKSKTEQASILQ